MARMLANIQLQVITIKDTVKRIKPNNNRKAKTNKQDEC